MDAAPQKLGPDGLLEPDEVINAAPMVFAVASAGLLLTCAAMGWVIKKFVSQTIDRAFDRSYWADN